MNNQLNYISASLYFKVYAVLTFPLSPSPRKAWPYIQIFKFRISKEILYVFFFRQIDNAFLTPLIDFDYISLKVFL